MSKPVKVIGFYQNENHWCIPEKITQVLPIIKYTLYVMDVVKFHLYQRQFFGFFGKLCTDCNGVREYMSNFKRYNSNPLDDYKLSGCSDPVTIIRSQVRFCKISKFLMIPYLN